MCKKWDHSKNVQRPKIYASFDITLKIWDIKTGKEEFTLKGHQDSVNTVAIASS